jgi:hypothetical protein
LQTHLVPRLMVGFLLILGACAQEAPEEQISLGITSPTGGATIKGNVVVLDVEAEGITIVKADGDTSGTTGHFHVFIDKDPVAAGAVIPVEAGVVHSPDDPITIPGLSVGRHTFTLVLGDGAHNRIGEFEEEVSLTIQGPSVDATAPAEAAAGQQISLNFTVEGVTLVAAAQDPGTPPGGTGHLHVLIDPATPPTANGQPIPPNEEGKIYHTAEASFTIPALTAGAHTIWIVLGDKTHIPFDPLVADKLTVTVK